jgi:formiminotetrahydrofolate cyclodeaminase
VASLLITDDSLTGVVAAAALSAAMALRVVRMVLETAARKQSTARLQELIAEAETEANRLIDLAREDGEAYAAYMRARKDQEALRRAIETPMSAARSAAEGIALCEEAIGFVRGAIAADVRGAVPLLAGAVRAILCSVGENLRVVEDEAFAREVGEEAGRLQRLAVSS